MAVVKIKLRESKEGFQVDLINKELDIETEGFLPPLPPKLETSFNNWQQAYRQIDAVRSVFTSQQLRITPKSITKYSSTEYTTSVKECLNQWLNCGDRTWLPIRDKLISIAQLHQQLGEIRVIIDATDVNLRRLPWQEWNLFEEHYPQVEIALSAARNTSKNITVLPKSSKIRVLVTVGRSDGINTKNDLKVIKELEQHGAEVICLMQPSRKELCNALWDSLGYHIFIFTGHSGSREDGQIGWIELNDKDNLSIEEFKEALKQAINKGLQLAIFNSCDGLGLANQLAQLHLPRCIVMREPVPDNVAVEFLKHFFEEFTRNQSVSKALNKARKRLEHFNLDYPGAVWLPTICIAPNTKPLTWKSLNKGNNSYQEEQLNKPKLNISTTIKPFILIALVIGSVYTLLAWNLSTKRQEIIDMIRLLSIQQSTFIKLSTKLSGVNVPSGDFLYGGSTTWEPLRKSLEVEIHKNHPNFRLIPQGAIGSEASINIISNDKLENGKLDFVLSSRHLKESETRSQRGDFKLKSIAVAKDGIAIAVNHQLQIEGLTIQNLKDIYTGKITNWKQLDGTDLPIIPYSRKPNQGGTPQFFIEQVLRDGEFGKNIRFVNTTTEGLQKILTNPGAIYYASAAEVIPQCSVKALSIGQTSNNLVSLYKKPFISAQECNEKNHNQVNIEELNNNYPENLTRKLYVIIKQTDSTNLVAEKEDLKVKATEAGNAYVEILETDEGKQLIRKAGFVPMM